MDSAKGISKKQEEYFNETQIELQPGQSSSPKKYRMFFKYQSQTAHIQQMGWLTPPLWNKNYIPHLDFHGSHGSDSILGFLVMINHPFIHQVFF